MIRWACFLAIVCLLPSCREAHQTSPPISLQHKWTIGEGLRSPESVIYDNTRDVLYISSVNGYEKNGLGYLSTATPNGVILDSHWVAGLNGPTGMALNEGKLYVADIDELLEIDIVEARIANRYPSPDPSPGLNDVARDRHGQIYVSGSFSRTIYRLSGDSLMTWVQSDQLKDANGLYADSTRLLFAGYYLKQITYTDGSIAAFGNDSLLVDLESIEGDGSGGYFLTAIGERPIWHLNAVGEATAVLVRDTYSADIEYVQEKHMLFVPSSDNRLFAFDVRWR